MTTIVTILIVSSPIVALALAFVAGYIAMHHAEYSGYEETKITRSINWIQRKWRHK